MGILLFVVFGFVVGMVARALMPGRQQMGILTTTGLGIAGSFVGGMVASAVTHRQLTDFHMAGVIGSVIGAVVVLAVVFGISHRRAWA